MAPQALLIPLIVIPILALLIVSIGTLLLAVGKLIAVPTALGLAILVIVVCARITGGSHESAGDQHAE